MKFCLTNYVDQLMKRLEKYEERDMQEGLCKFISGQHDDTGM